MNEFPRDPWDVCIFIYLLIYHRINHLCIGICTSPMDHMISGTFIKKSLHFQQDRGLALGKLLHDCPDLVAKNQELTRLVRDSEDRDAGFSIFLDGILR